MNALAALRRPPWEEGGGVSSADAGVYQETIAALRGLPPLTEIQRAQIIDAIASAKKRGVDASCLDPTAPPSIREPAFADIIRPAIRRGEISGVTLTDRDTLNWLYEQTLSWGPQVQALLDDPTVTEVKIMGCAVTAASHRGGIAIPGVYASIDEPMSRVQALAQMLGVPWDHANPSVTLSLPNKTRLHATRHPLLAAGDLLVVIRRGRQRPWRLADLVDRGALNEEAATLLERLVQGSLSVIVSGPQDSGKTTMLECLLNAMPADRHIILVEDNTDEFNLATQHATRLHVNSFAASSAHHDAFGIVVRETLRMNPDVLVPGEIRGSEAGAVAQIGESGKPTLTTIHARSPEAAVRRFARLAAAEVPGNTFARQPEAALLVIATVFHLVIQMTFSRRIGRRIVQQVVLMNGLDEHGRPSWLPLIDAQYETEAEGGVVWRCHARWDGATLAWNDSAYVVPEAVRLALEHSLECEPRALRQVAPAANQIAAILARARDLLAYPDQAEQVTRLLEQAAALDSQAHEVWTLADRLLAANHDLRRAVEEQAERAIEDIAGLMDRRLLEAARARAEEAMTALLLRLTLERHAEWQRLLERMTRMEAHDRAAHQALLEAHQVAREHGDLGQALALLAPFDARSLSHPVARNLVEARRRILHAALQRVPPNQSHAAQRLRAQLELAERDAAALDSTAPTSACAGASSSSGPPDGPHDDGPARASCAAAPPLDEGGIPRLRAESAEPVAFASPRSDGEATEAAIADTSLPIHTRAAEDVGDGSWRRMWESYRMGSLRRSPQEDGDE